MRRLHFPQLYKIGIRFPKTTLCLSLAVTIISLIGVSQLKLEGDLTALLPKNAESVKNLQHLQTYFGGSSYLYVTIESPDQAAAEQFADVFSARLQSHPEILYVDYHHPVDYFEKRQWFYMELDDLIDIEKRVDKALTLEKKGVSSTFSSLTDFADPEERADLDFNDIRQKYETHLGVARSYVTPDGEKSLIILRIKSRKSAPDINFSRAFIADIKHLEQELKQEKQYAPIHVGYTGNYETKIETVDHVKKEVAVVSTVVSLLLIMILLCYFRSVHATILVCLPLFASLLWTGGLTYLILGHLNIVTSFGAAILGGLGSDYGVYLLTRYYQERELGTDFLTACDRAFAKTGRATFDSMVTSCGCFLALLLSSFSVFVEFGIVGAVGTFAAYIAMAILIPSLLTLQETYQPLAFHQSRFFVRLLGKKGAFCETPLFERLFATRKALTGISLTLLLCFAAALSLRTETQILFENGLLDYKNLPGNQLYERVSSHINATLNPTTLTTTGWKEEEKIVRNLTSLLNSKNHQPLVYKDVLGLSTFIPQDQAAKKLLLSRLKGKVEKLHLMIKVQKKNFLTSIQASLEASTITRETLPKEATRLFVSPYQDDMYAVYIFPAVGRNSSEETEYYRSALAAYQKNLGLTFTMTDGNFITADTVHIIRQEAPHGLLLLLAFLTIFLFITMRPISHACVVLVHLVGGLFLMSGFLWLMHIHLNILNIAAITIVLGTGIDSFIHFSQSYDETRNMRDTLKTKVPAIFIANLTTIVGIGGLLFTSCLGLRSIGWFAVVGLTLITLLAVFIFPRCLTALPPSHRRPTIVP